MKKKSKFIKKEKKFLISLSILMIGQAVLYWTLKQFQGNPIYINSTIDDKIPFWGWLIYVYNMFYPFCIIAFYLLYQNDEEAYYKSIIAGVIGFLISDVIFLFMPTIMYRPMVPNYDAFTNFVIKVTFYFDEPPLNCLPSIHCLFCFQVIYGFINSKCDLKQKIWIIIGASIIILSTLFVKQHYFYDVIAAFLVCLISNMLESLFKIYQKLKTKKIL